MSSGPCIVCEVPRELVLHTDQLMPPLEIGFERFEENELESATILEHEELDCRIRVPTFIDLLSKVFYL